MMDDVVLHDVLHVPLVTDGEVSLAHGLIAGVHYDCYNRKNLKLGFGKLASCIHCESQSLEHARLLSKTENLQDTGDC